MRFSLLHATYGSGSTAVALRDEWLTTAAQPARVEHIFSSNADDRISAACPEIATGLVGKPTVGVTAVRNWNAAAEAAIGEILVVIADDLHPCLGWDALLDQVTLDLDPCRVPFVLKVTDNPAEPDRLSHPIVSRSYYERFGLWNPEYEGHFVDNDFTLAAHGHGVVIDGRQIYFPHVYGTETSMVTRSQQLMADRTYDSGRVIFDRQWPMWRRRRSMRYFTPVAGSRTLGEPRRLWRCAVCRAGYVQLFAPRRTWRRVRRFMHHVL
jgi:hypothetical protein